MSAASPLTKVCVEVPGEEASVGFAGFGISEGREVEGVGPRSMPGDAAEAEGSYEDDCSEDMEEELEEEGHERVGRDAALTPRQPLSYNIRASDLNCLICLEPFKNPVVTKCGHSFCYACVMGHLENRQHCPQCRAFLCLELTYPNIVLQQLVEKAARVGPTNYQTPLQKIRAVLDEDAVGLDEAKQIVEAAWEKKQQLEERNQEYTLGLLTRFLEHAKAEKERELQQLQEQVQLLDADLETVAKGRLLRSTDEQRRLTSSGARPSGAAAFFGARTTSALPGTSAALAGGSSSHRLEGRAHSHGRARDVPEPNRVFQQSISSIAAYTQWKGKSRAFAVEGVSGKAAEARDETGGMEGKERGYAVAGPSSSTLQGQCVQRDAIISLSRGERAGSAADGDLESADGLSDCDASNDSLSDHSGLDDDSLDELDSDDEMDNRRNSRAQEKRVASQFDDLHRAYLNVRSRKRRKLDHPVDLTRPGDALESEQEGPAPSSDSREALLEFGKVLSAFVQCSNLQVVAQLTRADPRQQAAILSSIEFSTETRFFATAGVTKRISIYDFDAVLGNPNVEAHCPTKELTTLSKLSCLSWNKFVRNHLISSDYDGGVQLWDVEGVESPIHEYEAHDKRIWSVDFCTTEHMQFVSGSDDGWVKTWDSRSPDVNCQINVKANVCSVKYNPKSSYEIAVGSADHHVHVFDTRNTAGPLRVFTGHRKAVSYVKYLDPVSLMSASTDSTLRLWDVPSRSLSHVYRAHVNEKNFVGLSVEGDFLACGSETNEVFVYHREMSTPIAQRLFSEPAMGPGSETVQFISAVCWKPNSHNLLAANSQGTIQIMELTSAASVNQGRVQR